MCVSESMSLFSSWSEMHVLASFSSVPQKGSIFFCSHMEFISFSSHFIFRLPLKTWISLFFVYQFFHAQNCCSLCISQECGEFAVFLFRQCLCLFYQTTFLGYIQCSSHCLEASSEYLVTGWNSAYKTKCRKIPQSYLPNFTDGKILKYFLSFNSK